MCPQIAGGPANHSCALSRFGNRRSAKDSRMRPNDESVLWFSRTSPCSGLKFLRLRHLWRKGWLFAVLGGMAGVAPPTARSPLAPPEPPRSLAVVPLIAAPRYYGGAPARP